MTSFRFSPAALGALLAILVVGSACAGNDTPQLVALAPTAMPVATATPQPTPPAEPSRTPAPAEPTPAATATPVALEPLTRGVTDQAIRIGVIKSGAVFGDVELGVEARLARLNADGGVGGRLVELGPVVDDGGDPAAAMAAAVGLVEDDEVFAIVLASAAPEPEVTDYLAQAQVPFFGWGFAPGFCEPNGWGFGFNGCLIGPVLGVPGAVPDVSARELTSAFFDRPATVVLVTSDDAAGDAAVFAAEDVWADQLLDVVRVGADQAAPFDSIDPVLTSLEPDVVLLALPLGQTVTIKGRLIASTDAMVLDNVAYLPGLLGDFATADGLEGGYSTTQFPPQEEYRAVTAVVATDLENVGAGLVYSQAVSLGYWSTDLMAVLLEAVGPDLNTATFHQVVVDGVRYEPELDGAPCPLDTREIHRSPSGGGALVRVQGGIYRSVVQFACF